jgi:hypothetical protein
MSTPEMRCSNPIGSRWFTRIVDDGDLFNRYVTARLLVESPDPRIREVRVGRRRTSGPVRPVPVVGSVVQ